MRLFERRIPPPFLAVIIAPLMCVLAGHSPGVSAAPLLRYPLIALLAVCGVALDFTGVATFLRRKTVLNPFAPHKASTLVTTGAYRLTRNPMYVGLLLLLLAWALWLGSWGALAGPAFFFGWVDRFQIRPEEAALKEVFGAPYLRYLQQVRRWL
jgi:protein-S-isoprenylcysteine O-methyltransferase Ste14